MRISDWSSDVCSSDLQAQPENFDLRWRRSAAEAAPEVGPLRIVALDQGDLPRARPAFQRLLAADGRLDAVKHIEIDEGLHAVPLREAVDEPLAMLIDAAWQVVCHADRSEERRGGKECVSTCRSRWSPCH